MTEMKTERDFLLEAFTKHNIKPLFFPAGAMEAMEEAMEAFHQSKMVEDEEIDRMFPMTYSDGTVNMDDTFCQMKRKAAKQLRDRIFNK